MLSWVSDAHCKQGLRVDAAILKLLFGLAAVEALLNLPVRTAPIVRMDYCFAPPTDFQSTKTDEWP